MGVRTSILSPEGYKTQLAELQNIMMNLASSERVKEINYIKRKIEILRTETNDNELVSQIETLLNSSDPGRLSAIINLLLKRKAELEKIIQEYDQDNGAMKSSGVFDRKFKQYMYKRINEFIEGKGTKSKLSVDLDLSLKDIIDGFLKENIYNNTDIVEDSELYQLTYQQIINELKNKNVLPKSWFDNNGAEKRITSRSLITQINSKGKSGSIRQRLQKWLPSIISGIGLEWKVTAEGITMIGHAEQTGGTEVKEDVVILDSAQSEIDIDPNFFKDNLKGLDIIKRVKRMAQLIEEIAGRGGFLLLTSEKDYGSNSDLHVGSGSIANLVPRLNRIANSVGESKETIDRILFNLNNALEDGDESNALDSLAMVCAAWMFDDIEQMFRSNGKDNILHIYNINGYYMLLSDLLLEAAQTIGGVDPQQLVKVSLSSWGSAHEMWEEERVKYLTKHNQLNSQPTEPIWKNVRKNMMMESKVSIKLNYKVISSFSDALRELLRGSLHNTE